MNRREGRDRDELQVAVYGNWDFDEALRLLSPGASRRWGGLRFGGAAEIPDPDFVLILNCPDEAGITLTMPPERIWFGVGEPPPFVAYHAGQGIGTVLLTCDEAIAARPSHGRHAILTHPVIRTWHVERSFDELAAMGPIEKPKLLSWVTSDAEVIEGHKLRMRFLRSIRERLPFDLFGRGFKALPDKWNGIAPYRYSIAFENHRSASYFTEKIMDCFVCRTFPIYYGCPNLEKYFPSAAFARFDPEDPSAADRMSDLIQSNVWEEAQGALEEAKWLVLNKYNMLAQVSDLMRRAAPPPGTARTVRLKAIGNPLLLRDPTFGERLLHALRRRLQSALGVR